MEIWSHVILFLMSSSNAKQQLKQFHRLLEEQRSFFDSRALFSMSFSSPSDGTRTSDQAQSNSDGAQTPLLIPGALSAAPSDNPSGIPSGVPSDLPSLSPTAAPIRNELAFACSEDGVGSALHPVDQVTQLRFKILYLVESSSDVTEFIGKLERLLILTATAGALQCSTGGQLFENRDTDTFLSTIPSNTTVTTAPCESNLLSCLILETEFFVVVNQQVDPDVAVFLGNLFVRDEIEDGLVTETIPQINRTEYIGPQPLLPTIVADDDDLGGTQIPILQATERVTVSAWTVGAVLAMSVGGVVAIGAWFRNRRTRNRRHMQLVEDMSMASPSSEAP